MNQDKLEKILLSIGRKLESHWNIEPEINYQGSIILKNFVIPSRKNIPEENVEIIKNSIEAEGEVFNFTEWTQIVVPTNDLVITYYPS